MKLDRLFLLANKYSDEGNYTEALEVYDRMNRIVLWIQDLEIAKSIKEVNELLRDRKEGKVLVVSHGRLGSKSLAIAALGLTGVTCSNEPPKDLGFCKTYPNLGDYKPKLDLLPEPIQYPNLPDGSKSPKEYGQQKRKR